MDQFEQMLHDGTLSQSRPLLEAVVLLMPQNVKALFYLGLLASEDGDLPKARSLFTQATHASEGDSRLQPNALHMLAMVALAQGDTAEARRALKQAIGLNPDDDELMEQLQSLQVQLSCAA